MLVSSRIIAQGDQFNTRSSLARRESVAATIWACRISLIRACRRAWLEYHQALAHRLELMPP